MTSRVNGSHILVINFSFSFKYCIKLVLSVLKSAITELSLSLVVESMQYSKLKTILYINYRWQGACLFSIFFCQELHFGVAVHELHRHWNHFSWLLLIIYQNPDSSDQGISSRCLRHDFVPIRNFLELIDVCSLDTPDIYGK